MAMMNSRSTPPSPLVLCGFVVLLFILLFTSPYLYHFDGAVFHLQNFLVGQINNSFDVSRIGAILLTDALDLFYVHLGGKNFVISYHLYSFGETFHILWPLFFLWWVTRIEPEKKEWALHGLWIYCFSLFLLRGMGLSFVVSEMNVTHTITWLAIFSFQAGARYLWLHRAITGLSVFCYPSAIIVSSAFFFHEILKKKKTAWFYAVLIFGALGIFEYFYPQNSTGSFFSHSFHEIERNYTLHLYLLSLVLLSVKEYFPGQRLVIIITCVAYYIASISYGGWHTFRARLFGMFLTMSIQIIFILIPEQKWKSYFLFLWPRILSFMVLSLAMIVLHLSWAHMWHHRVVKLLDREKRSLGFEEARKKLYPYDFLSRVDARMMTITLELLKGPRIEAVINPGKYHHVDLICLIGEKEFRNLLKVKNITIGPHVKFEDCGLRPE